MLFFTSDLHFGHDKPFIYGPRGFANVEEMDEAIVRIWNETVADDDDVYVLGDIMLIDNDLGIELWNRLRGRKHVIIGNHDTAPRVELLRKCRNTKVVGYADLIRYKGYSIYVSHYPTMTGNYDESKFMKNCVINVCGHTHTSDKFADIDKGWIYHVDPEAHDNRPVPVDQIIADMIERLGDVSSAEE